jgi:lysophospholipase L1-like esterase
VSDVDESGLTRSQVGALRAAYESNLAAVLGEIQAAGARVIVSGPSLLGERPRGQNPKDAQLDAYVSINRRLAVRFKGRYLDTRRLLLEHAGSSAGPLTEDGEHLSDAGVRLLAVELAKALGEALRSRRSS